MSDIVYIRGESLQDGLRDMQTYGMILTSAYVLHYLSATWLQLQMGVSADWYVTIEHWRLSLIRIIFINYQTRELQYNYQSYIQEYSIGDAQSFSGVAFITPSGGFSIETLTEV